MFGYGGSKTVRNVTIEMDESLVSLTESEARRMGMSLSDFIANLVSKAVEERQPEASNRNCQKEALERILAGPKWDVTENGRMLTAEERNARR